MMSDSSAVERALDQPRESGRVLAFLFVYLAAFAVSLLIFLRGLHSFAFVLLIGVWLILAIWLHRMGRP